MSISKRLKGPTPIFFKKVRTWIIWLSGSLVAAGGTFASIPGMVSAALGKAIEFPIISQIGIYCIIIGTVCGILGTFLTSLPLEINQETKEEAKEEVKEIVKTALADDTKDSSTETTVDDNLKAD